MLLHVLLWCGIDDANLYGPLAELSGVVKHSKVKLSRVEWDRIA